LTTLAQVRNRTDISVIVLAYMLFVMLGMPGAMLGVAWPSMRDTFNLELDTVWDLLAFSAVGYTMSSFLSGRLVYRLGYTRLLIVSTVLGIVGAAGYIFAPVWEVVLLAGMVLGLGGGTIDAAMNTYFSANYGPRLMSWLHACYGVGTVAGPFVMTTLLNAQALWRWGYVIFALFSAALVVGVVLTARQWRAPQLPSGTSTPKAGLSDTLRLPVMWLLIVLITLVVGLEFSPGQWTFSLFTESRSMTVDLAGLMVTLYWGGFMVGRFLFGALGNNLKPGSALRGCIAAAAVGAVLVWLDAGPAVNFVGVILMGLAKAPIFPLLVTAIPERVGGHHAANAIGFLISAAGVGIAILPGLVGRLAKNNGLEVIGPLLLVIAVGMFVLHEMLVRYRTPQK